ncbi:hypothetical protein IWW54_002870, partial [Coemansia sp. RSA 2705]
EDLGVARSRSYSSANISTAAESAASGSSRGSVDLARAAMRSVSVDCTREYGLHMLHGDVAGPRAAETAAGAEDAAAARSQSAPAPGSAAKPQVSLTKRLLGPLTRKHGGSTGGAASDNQDIVGAEQSDSEQLPVAEPQRSLEPPTAANSSDAATAARGPSVPSKSLDIDRRGVLARGPLSRRTMQRSKQEDAIYNHSADAKGAAMGPARFQALSRSLVSRLGFSSLLAERRRAGDLRFVVAPHAQLGEVVEVYDCDGMVPVYRKVSRSGKSWHETFHEIDPDAEAQALGCLGVPSDYEMAAALGLPYPGIAGYGSTTAAASCVTFQSSTSSAVADNRRALRDTVAGLSSAPSFVNAGTVRMARGVTLGAASMYAGVVPFDQGLLWEALTPLPNQFPLHIKDARTVIDTVSLASMVLDRHNFCYRFQLGHNRMRWVARRARKHQLALQCFVRNVLVAEVFVDYEKGYSPYNMPGLPAPNSSSSGGSTPVESEAGAGSSATACLPEDGALPVVTILPAAFDQLASFDETIVESFIIFTGMQMLECLHI